METLVTAWRDSMRPVRFFAFDARLLMLFVVWLFVPNLWTTAAVILALLAVRIVEARGVKLGAALRLGRARAAGRRHVLYASRVRRFTDFG